jgi:hypothetical protein
MADAVGPTEPMPTLREPLGDICAQWQALNDLAHPKDTMWLSKGNPVPREWQAEIARAPGLYSVVELASGTLITSNPDKAEYFKFCPTEETLADVLDYVRPKSLLDWDRSYILQAVDPSGNVITEMMVEPQDEQQARLILAQHGVVISRTVVDTLVRRLILLRAWG